MEQTKEGSQLPANANSQAKNAPTRRINIAGEEKSQRRKDKMNLGGSDNANIGKF